MVLLCQRLGVEQERIFPSLQEQRWNSLQSERERVEQKRKQSQQQKRQRQEIGNSSWKPRDRERERETGSWKQRKIGQELEGSGMQS